MEELDGELGRPAQKPEDFEELSIEALEERIAELEAEIERLRDLIAKKQQARGAADSVFKT